MPGSSCVTMNNNNTVEAFDKASASCRQALRSSKTPPKNINEYVDLVKSHLMYAVREEVEVLKEQIKELMDRMRQVEYENQVLRSEATPETLAKLPPALPPLANPTLQQFMTTPNNST